MLPLPPKERQKLAGMLRAHRPQRHRFLPVLPPCVIDVGCVLVDLPDENQFFFFFASLPLMLLTVLLYSYIIATLCSVLALAFPFLF